MESPVQSSKIEFVTDMSIASAKVTKTDDSENALKAQHDILKTTDALLSFLERIIILSSANQKASLKMENLLGTAKDTAKTITSTFSRLKS